MQNWLMKLKLFLLLGWAGTQLIGAERIAYQRQVSNSMKARLSEYGFTRNQMANIYFEPGSDWVASRAFLHGFPIHIITVPTVTHQQQAAHALLHEMGHVQQDTQTELAYVAGLTARISLYARWAKKSGWNLPKIVASATGLLAMTFLESRALGYWFEMRADQFAINRLLQYPSEKNYQELLTGVRDYQETQTWLDQETSQKGLDLKKWSHRLMWYTRFDVHPMPEQRAAKFEKAAHQMRRQLDQKIN